MELTYEATQQPGDFGMPSKGKDSSDGKRLNNLGLEISNLTDDVAKRLGLEGKSGVLITSVRNNSPAAEAGLRTGMLIVEVNRRNVESVSEFEAAIKSAEQSEDGVLLLVQSEQGSRFIVVKP
jgi:serine protease Do